MKKILSRKTRRAFTLVEVLIGVVFVALFGIIVISQFISLNRNTSATDVIDVSAPLIQLSDGSMKRLDKLCLIEVWDNKSPEPTKLETGVYIISSFRRTAQNETIISLEKKPGDVLKLTNYALEFELRRLNGVKVWWPDENGYQYAWAKLDDDIRRGK